MVMESNLISRLRSKEVYKISTRIDYNKKMVGSINTKYYTKETKFRTLSQNLIYSIF